MKLKEANELRATGGCRGGSAVTLFALLRGQQESKKGKVLWVGQGKGVSGC